MPPRKVLPLDVACSVDASMVGAKAMSLFRMLGLGLPVPPGFCITTDAHRDHLDSANLTPRIAAAVAELEQAEPEKKKDILSEVRQIIIESPMAETLRRQIEEHYRAFSGKRTAVRSSATAEDLPGQSFAGQYDTYLGVGGPDECIEAVKKCWASLWTERAYDYRQKNAMNHLDVRMAVVVQEMVEADVSGITFTADPVTADTDKVVIEAARGLGEDIVRGKVTPDRFVLTKRALTIANRRCAEPDGTLCIDDSAAKRLAELAIEVESHFGVPQDIEWSMEHGQIWLLQSRPITTLPPKKSWEDRQVWSNLFAQEVLPDVVTPSTLSIIEELSQALFDPVFRTLSMDRGDHPVYGVLAGRVYFNVNIWIAVIRLLPGVRRYDFAKDAGSEEGLLRIFELEKNMTDDDLPELNFRLSRFLLRMPLLILGTLSKTPRKGQSIISEAKAKNGEWRSIDVSRLSTRQIIDSCNQIIADFRELCGKVLYLLSAMSAVLMLETVCAKWLPTEENCAKRLLGGLGDMEDALAGLDLWRLALVADSNPQIRDIITSDKDWQTISDTLSETERGGAFLAAWGKFMDRHGHHCRAEIELCNRRWFETPDYVLSLLRGYIGSIGRADPLANHRRVAAQRDQLAQKCRKRLRNPIKRMVFNHLLVRSQRGSVFRENIKCEIIKLLTSMRTMLLELGRRLATESAIEQPGDIFFLRFEEIELVTQGRADFDAPKVAASRRDEYMHWQSITPPGTIVGKYTAQRIAPKPADTDAKMLTGLAVSPGVVTGKARVILRANTDEQVLAGEILVAPFTDPGWTPYFVPAAGIIMEQGSLLSHGSIVAREFGIPAVANVGQATRIIKSGQRIQVDGNHGIVRILAEHFAADGSIT